MMKKWMGVLLSIVMVSSMLTPHALATEIVALEDEIPIVLMESVGEDEGHEPEAPPQGGDEGGGQIEPSPLAVSAPNASSDLVRVGQTIVWEFALQGAESGHYHVERQGEAVAEGALDASASSVSWTPDVPGTYVLIVTAQRGEESAVAQSNSVIVEDIQPDPLAAHVAVSQGHCAVGETITIGVEVAGGVAPYDIATAVTRDGAQIADGGSSVIFVADAPGTYTVTAHVTDAAGSTTEVSDLVSCAPAVEPEGFDPGVALTGDPAQDLVAVAQSQMGYFAAQDSAPGYSRFGDWYDSAYNGDADAQTLICGPWSAAFVSYCAEFAGIAESILPRSANVAGWSNAIAAYVPAEGHVPMVGDVVFLRVDDDRVGIVASVSEGAIAAIEGDVDGTVALRQYAMDGGEIVGFVPIADRQSVQEPVEDGDETELIYVSFGQAVQGLVINSITPDAPMVALGQTVVWSVEIDGATDEVSYRYELMKDGQVIAQSELVAENTYTFVPDTAGVYTLVVEVADASGATTLSEGVPVAVSEVIADDSWNIIPDQMEYTGGIISQGVIPYDENGEPIFRLFAKLSDLTVAYVTCDRGTLLLGEPATWTTVASGGDGQYRYLCALYYQKFTDTSVMYTKVTESPVMEENVFTYTPTAPGRYFLMVLVIDEENHYVKFQSVTFQSADITDINNINTIAGKVSWVVSNVTNSDMTDVEKARALHDWLIYNAEYDLSYTYYYADGVLLRGTGVCQSYGEAYRLLCYEVGIPCLYVRGTAGGESHGWNVVYLNGSWWHIDCTWDDPVGGHYERHDYFMLKDEQIRTTHSWDTSWLDNEMDGLYPTGITVPVSYITLSSTQLTLVQNREKQVIVSLSPANATNAWVTWTTNNPNVVYVDAFGVIRGLAPGTAVVTARTANGKTASVVVTVLDPYLVVSVAFTTPLLQQELFAEEPLNLSNYVNVVPDTAPTNLTWAVSLYPAYVDVGTNGVITAKKAGTSTVRVTTTNGGKSATVQVRIVDSFAPTSIAIAEGSAKTLGLYNSPTIALHVTSLPVGSKVKTTWTSSVPTVATVDANGVVKAVKPGTTVITATSQNGRVAYSTITVIDEYAPTGITIDRGSVFTLNLYAPEDPTKALVKYPIETTMTPGDARSALTWTSSIPTVAAFENGELVMKHVGTTVITVRTYNGKTATATVNVIDPLLVTAVGIDAGTTVRPVRLSLDGTLQLASVITPVTGQTTLTWKSSLTAIATVDATGLVTPLRVGTTTITVTTANLKAASIAVTVYDPLVVTSVAFTASLLQQELFAEEPLNLSNYVNVVPDTAPTNLTWAVSLYPAYVDVGTNGVITAKKAGTSTVRVTTTNGGKSATVQVRIVDSFAPTSIAIAEGSAKTLGLYNSPTIALHVTSLPVGSKVKTTWTSSVPTVATVDANGVVKAVKPGTTVITATSQNGRVAYSTITVIDEYAPTGITIDRGSVFTLNLYAPEDPTKALVKYPIETTMTPGDARSALTWTSSIPTVAAFENGELVMKHVGTTVITVRTYNGKTATATVNVIDPLLVTAVGIDAGTTVRPVRLSLDGTLQLASVITPVTGQTTLTWKSSLTAIATVDATGLVTPLRVGTTTITVTTANLKAASIAVTVYDPLVVTSVAFTASLLQQELFAEEPLNLSNYVNVVPDTAPTNLTWAVSLYPAYVDVGTNGVITAKKAGTSTVRVTTTNGGKSATVQVRIVDSFAPTSIAIAEGSAKTLGLYNSPTIALHVTSLPVGSKVKTTWTSSVPTVATVDANGVVKAVKPGTTVITATSQNGRVAYSTITVIDEYAPTGITIDRGSVFTLNLYAPEDPTKALVKYPIETTMTPGDARSALTWTSSIPTVAAFENGELVMKHVGTTVITVRTYNGKTATATVNVIDPLLVTAVGIDAGTTVRPVRLSLDGTLQLASVITPVTGQTTLTWKSSLTAIATVDATGLVTPLRVGTTTITVTTANLKAASIAVTVYDPLVVTSVAFTASLLQQELFAEEPLNLSNYVNVVPDTAPTNLTWAVSLYPAYVDVGTNGVITAKKAGTSTVRVTTTNGGKSATVQVRIVDSFAPTSIAIAEGSAKTLGLYNSPTIALHVTSLPVGSKVKTTWTSSVPTVATVDANGVVKAKMVGTTYIYATSQNGRMATIRITVVAQ